MLSPKLLRSILFNVDDYFRSNRIGQHSTHAFKHHWVIRNHHIGVTQWMTFERFGITY